MKSTELMTFENEVLGSFRGFIDQNGEPWFLAGQVCRCLGIRNSSDAINRIIEEHNKYQDHIKGVAITYSLIQTEGGKQKVCAITEPILYELVFKSGKEWVLEEPETYYRYKYEVMTFQEWAELFG